MRYDKKVKEFPMGKQRKLEEVSGPTLGPMDRVRKGQDAVNEAVSFVDWVRSIIDWIKGLFGR
jgi:hypothetical protein